MWFVFSHGAISLTFIVKHLQEMLFFSTSKKHLNPSSLPCISTGLVNSSSSFSFQFLNVCLLFLLSLMSSMHKNSEKLLFWHLSTKLLHGESYVPSTISCIIFWVCSEYFFFFLLHLHGLQKSKYVREWSFYAPNISALLFNKVNLVWRSIIPPLFLLKT